MNQIYDPSRNSLETLAFNAIIILKAKISKQARRAHRGPKRRNRFGTVSELVSSRITEANFQLSGNSRYAFLQFNSGDSLRFLLVGDEDIAKIRDRNQFFPTRRDLVDIHQSMDSQCVANKLFRLIKLYFLKKERTSRRRLARREKRRPSDCGHYRVNKVMSNRY